MKLFQIEEPDGTPLEAEGPGVPVGIDLAPGGGAAIAVAVGGNAEILGDDAGKAALHELFLALRGRAEKMLARPVTHAVIAADISGEGARRVLVTAAEAAGLTVLGVMERSAAAARARGAPAGDAPVLGAAIQAEDDAARLAPR